MKKRICLLIVLFLSLFVFCDKVDAYSMYLECKYTSECEKWKATLVDSNSWSRWCLPTVTKFVPITNKDGNLNYYAMGTLKDKKGEVYYVSYNLEQSGCWLKDFTDKRCKKAEKYDFGVSEIFSKGICPSGVMSERNANDLIYGFSLGIINLGNDDLDPVGQNGGIIKNSIIDETKYVIYSVDNGKDKNVMIAEGYNTDGQYCYAGTDVDKKWFLFGTGKDGIQRYLLSKAAVYGEDFWKVHTNFNVRMVASEDYDSNIKDGVNVCDGMTESECKKAHNYKTIIDSEDSNGMIDNAVKNWYDDNIESIEELKDLDVVVGNKKFVETAEKFNKTIEDGKVYKFSNNYTKDQFVEDLKKAYVALDAAFDMENPIIDYITGKGTSATSSIVTWIYKDDKNYLGIEEFVDIAESNDKDLSFNSGHILKAVERDVNEALVKFTKNNTDSIDIINLTDNLVEYTELFYTASAYMDANSGDYDLTASQEEDIAKLREDFMILSEQKELGIYPIVDCESLLGEDLINKLKKYWNIFRIAVPILLIGLGIVDFTKAIFASDEDKMKKAKDLFLKRIFIAVLIFLSPLLINLILKVANEVWSFISPDSCGIF